MSESESAEITKRVRGADIEVKQKPKASPVLRPRAVVSSPEASAIIVSRNVEVKRIDNNNFAIKFPSLDNDAMIGSINRSEERKAKKGLKSNDQIMSRASQRKNVATNVKICHRIIAKQSGIKIPEITKD